MQRGNGEVDTCVLGLQSGIGKALGKLEAALEDAKAAGCTVGANGSVPVPAGGEEADGRVPEGGTLSASASSTDATANAIGQQAVHQHPNPSLGKAIGCANRTGDALKEAADVDAGWVPKLRALKADDLKVSDKDRSAVMSGQDGVAQAGKKYLDTLP
ncbi:hypothetical protein [Streptomyces eurythermus]|uniref:hypothetical protein n=1 Tax=Streptomyces eurythermus TaxID=42237 RepID=UPI0036D3B468